MHVIECKHIASMSTHSVTHKKSFMLTCTFFMNDALLLFSLYNNPNNLIEIKVHDYIIQ